MAGEHVEMADHFNAAPRILPRPDWSKISPLTQPSRRRRDGARSRLAPLPALSSTANTKQLLRERRTQIKEQLKQVKQLLSPAEERPSLAPPLSYTAMELATVPVLPPIREATLKVATAPDSKPLGWRPPLDYSLMSRWAQDGKAFGRGATPMYSPPR
jgi:hypothetical protein|mmetsp:Transcript_38406/g.87238  ORF Transcript_38406/g.87238 Transcript_38406/m.87238 type:complete len:158 (-) Transcript_38406:78-551(-)